jgi:putative molybdopterin biosynthesis protein
MRDDRTEGLQKIAQFTPIAHALARISARFLSAGERKGSAELWLTGSHDVALDVVLGAVTEQGISSRSLAVGSIGGVAAVERGECDLAPVHLLDAQTGVYNAHLLHEGLSLIKG